MRQPISILVVAIQPVGIAANTCSIELIFCLTAEVISDASNEPRGEMC